MDLFTLLEEVQTIARNGLNYTENSYDRERYERLLALSAESYSDILDVSASELQAKLTGELGSITPKVSGEAAIFDNQGRILLMDRADGTGWCMPCGWSEPNERPADTAIRETLEETGLEVRIVRLVGVFSRKASAANGPHNMSGVLHLCEIVGGELTLSHEGLGLRYWLLDEVPRWHLDQEKKARAAHTMWLSEGVDAISD